MIQGFIHTRRTRLIFGAAITLIVFLAYHYLVWRQNTSYREVIVVLSDGEDTSSPVTFDEVLDAAKRSQTVIYTIGLGLDDPPGRLTPANGELGFRRLAQETGGRLFLAKRPEDLSDVYTTIADELTSQYVLGYLSRNERRDAGWRSIAVRVHRPQLQARTRAG